MWIITRLSGVISVDAVTRFLENDFGTYAQAGGTTFMISEKKVLATIVDAMRNNQDFVEVE